MLRKQTFSIPGVVLLTPEVFQDQRGFFLETFHHRRYQEAGIGVEFVQDNMSFSKKGVIRGMHFQTFPGQAKLVSVLKGVIWDVFADIRPESPTYLQWEAVELHATQFQQLFLPVGIAHGFCVLSDEALVQYKVSAHYNPATEKGFRYNDPTWKIAWPIKDCILSEKDAKAPLWQECCYV
jgi:dTDP-4-dehydrorhamnose 3,5-epimerase